MGNKQGKGGESVKKSDSVKDKSKGKVQQKKQAWR